MAFFIPVDLFGNFAEGWETGRKSVWDDRKQNEEVMSKRIVNIHDADTLYGRIQDTNNKYFDNYLGYQVNERKQPGKLAEADTYNVGATDSRDVAYEPGQRSLNKQTIRANNRYALAASNAARAGLYGGGGGSGGGVGATTTSPTNQVASYNFSQGERGGGGGGDAAGGSSSMFSFENPKPGQKVGDPPVGAVERSVIGNGPASRIDYATYKAREERERAEQVAARQGGTNQLLTLGAAGSANILNPSDDAAQPPMVPNPIRGRVRTTIEKAGPASQEEMEANINYIQQRMQELTGLDPSLVYSEEDEEALYGGIPDEQIMMLAQSGQLAPGIYQFSDQERFGGGIQVGQDGSIFTV